MVYIIPWDESDPDGSIVAASDIDAELQQLKLSLRERLEQVIPGFGDDGVDPKIIPQTTPTFVRGEAGVQSAISDHKFDSWIIHEDTDSIYDVVTNNFVIAVSGVYLLSANFSFTAITTEPQIVYSIRKNETEIIESGLITFIGSGLTGPSGQIGNRVSTNLTVVTALLDTDTIQIYGAMSIVPSVMGVGLSISKMN